jgi:Gluconate 2-dehydrogenase subunit 3
MKRRHFLALLGFFSLLGANAFWRPLRPSWGAEATEEHLTRSVAALADVMFPGDGLPKASDLGIDRRVLAMGELEGAIAHAVAWLDTHAAREGVENFLGLDEAHKLAALDAAFASQEAGLQPAILALRFHLGTAYYATPAVKSAFAYTGPPQPQGFPDFQERPA